MEKILESFLDVIPKLKDILQEDLAVAVADTTKFLYYGAVDTINLPIEVGQKLNTDEPLYKTMQRGKIDNVIVPKELFGVPFKSVSYPIKDSKGNVILFLTCKKIRPLIFRAAYFYNLIYLKLRYCTI